MLEGGGEKGGLHLLKYLASLALQGLISQYEHEQARDAYYEKWILSVHLELLQQYKPYIDVKLKVC
ncbi:hypothetical protein QYF52_19175 [Paenibacillus polymyxa]|uniref:hypothetical protein n=1 Tax=Paenibacillus polymyxa TaxID=1406 RepID=UPI0025B6893C|nr:hypothetical protein [Paenibacillus polymyxa]MDN4080074.1 hypothetical protein [Paenibacillus polymyxa]MDN4105104.1 hypothetical protein [Paenibacillus polymyxa]MDN4115396.1 hypothetical protein [Paenibacillus polymyxa]